MVGRWNSFWDGLFSGAMLVLRRTLTIYCKYHGPSRIQYLFWSRKTKSKCGLLARPEPRREMRARRGFSFGPSNYDSEYWSTELLYTGVKPLPGKHPKKLRPNDPLFTLPMLSRNTTKLIQIGWYWLLWRPVVSLLIDIPDIPIKATTKASRKPYVPNSEPVTSLIGEVSEGQPRFNRIWTKCTSRDSWLLFRF